MPADGFYEWRGPKTMREPLWIHPADEGLILFAGLFEAWQVQPGEWQTTFCLITTAANRLLEPIQNRMPVILDEAGAADWMNWREPDPLSLKRLLAPSPDNLASSPPESGPRFVEPEPPPAGGVAGPDNLAPPRPPRTGGGILFNRPREP